MGKRKQTTSAKRIMMTFVLNPIIKKIGVDILGTIAVETSTKCWKYCWEHLHIPQKFKFKINKRKQKSEENEMGTKVKDYLITEAAYPGNVGFMEMAQFYQVATRSQLDKMEKVIKNEDWQGFKRLIEKVLDVKLH